MNIENYLARIGYNGPVEPNLATLRELHRAHLLAVPFEVLDIHAGREIFVGADNAYRKIVEEKRGGFCYEHNGLFGAVLAEIGFGVTYLSGQVARPAGNWGPQYDHLALLVEVPGDEPYLADVGFSETSGEPLRWYETGPQRQGNREFRLTHTPEGRMLSLRPVGGEWVDRLKLSTVPRNLPDFAEMCHYHQTSPESPFPGHAFITLAQPYGRVTMNSQHLIVTRNGQKTETALLNHSAFFENLEHYFGIVLSPELRQGLERKLWPVVI